GHPLIQKRHPRHASWSTSTMPSSSRLYNAPEGQEATHDGFKQCSQIRGKYIMNVFSYSMEMCSCNFLTLGSSGTISLPPAKSSSQLEPHFGLSIYSPVIVDFGLATGRFSFLGLLIRCS